MTTYATLAARYADAFDSVAHGERAREAGRHLPFAALGELQAAGFGKVGVPEDAGGEGGGSETVLRLLMDLAARDVNTAHVWRSHLVFIATAMDQAPARRERWLRHIVDGDWAGSALDTYERARAWALEHPDETVGILAEAAKISPDVARTVILERTNADVSPVPGQELLDALTGVGRILVGTGSVDYQHQVDAALASILDTRFAEEAIR